jgi:hypothetical protein
LAARPDAFNGKCPAVIQFLGTIELRAAGQIQFKFVRSDGAQSPVQTMKFLTANRKAVSYTWSLGGPALPTYTGWVAIEIVAPEPIAGKRSNQAEFRIQCVENQAAKPDLGMCGFLKIGKQAREVKWNDTIVLTPDDATAISGGKPVFEIYYCYKEINGTAVLGPFKNKIFFNDKLVSQQTGLSLDAKEIKNVHTQAYCGPKEGFLQIKIDADNAVAESREDNNFHFIANLKFQGF